MNEVADLSEYLVKWNDIKHIESLGFGRTGVVDKCSLNSKVRGLEVGKVVAVKTFNGCDEYTSDIFLKESELLVKLKHPCIVNIHGILFPKESFGPAILMEYYEGGSLNELIGKKKLTHDNVSIICSGIALGMKYLHESGVIHRDLKPSDILLDEDYHPYISDFGSSRLEDSRVTTTGSLVYVNYTAPEMYSQDVYDKKVDVFSFGLILYEAVFNRRGFQGRFTEVMGDVIKGVRPNVTVHESSFANGVKGSIVDLIVKCWSALPGDRPDFEEIVETFRECDFAFYDDCDVNVCDLYVKGVVSLLSEDSASGDRSKDMTNDMRSTEVRFAEERFALAQMLQSMHDEQQAQVERNPGNIGEMKFFEEIRKLLWEQVRCVESGSGSVGKERIESLKRQRESILASSSKVDFGSNGFERNTEAPRFSKMAADQGSAEDQYNYALMLSVGDGVAVDKVNAARYYKMAADQGDAKAQYNYATVLASGETGQVDMIGASQYWTMVADQGISESGEILSRFGMV